MYYISFLSGGPADGCLWCLFATWCRETDTHILVLFLFLGNGNPTHQLEYPSSCEFCSMVRVWQLAKTGWWQRLISAVVLDCLGRWAMSNENQMKVRMEERSGEIAGSIDSDWHTQGDWLMWIFLLSIDLESSGRQSVHFGCVLDMVASKQSRDIKSSRFRSAGPWCLLDRGGTLVLDESPNLN